MPVAIWFPDMKILKILLNIFTNVTASPMKVSALLPLSLRQPSDQVTTTFLVSKNKGNYDSYLWENA